MVNYRDRLEVVKMEIEMEKLVMASLAVLLVAAVGLGYMVWQLNGQAAAQAAQLAALAANSGAAANIAGGATAGGATDDMSSHHSGAGAGDDMSSHHSGGSGGITSLPQQVGGC